MRSIRSRTRGRVGLAIGAGVLASLVAPTAAALADAPSLADIPSAAAAVSIDFGSGTLVDGGAAIAVPVTVTCEPGAASVPVVLKVVQAQLNGALASGAVSAGATCGVPTSMRLETRGDLFVVGPAWGQIAAAAPGGPVTQAKPIQIAG